MGKHEAQNQGWTPNARTRAYLYAVAGAAGAVAVGYGVISDREVDLWLTLVGVILLGTNTVALSNVDKSK